MSIDPTTPVLQKLRPRDAVERMHEYHPPLAGRDGLRLDFNENTFAPSLRVQAVLQRIAADTLTKYPERHHVEQIVAKHFGLAEDAVLLTNGVDEAIHLLCETYLEPQDEARHCDANIFHVRLVCGSHRRADSRSSGRQHAAISLSACTRVR